MKLERQKNQSYNYYPFSGVSCRTISKQTHNNSFRIGNTENDQHQKMITMIKSENDHNMSFLK